MGMVDPARRGPYVCAYMCIYAHICAYMCIYVRICACMCVYVRVCAYMCIYVHICAYMCIYSVQMIVISMYTSSTAQGGGGSFKNRKPIGEVGCCESRMAERSHWWIERCLISLTLSLSFSAYLPTYLSIFYVSIQLSIYLSISLSLSFICLSV